MIFYDLLWLPEHIVNDLRFCFQKTSLVGSECCGLILGSYQKYIAHAQQLVPVHNVHQQKNSFMLPLHTYRQAKYISKKCNWDIIGIYHSHPNGKPYPSPMDVRGIENSDYPWLILAPAWDKQARPELVAFQQGTMKPITIQCQGECKYN
ncbi:M67 family metallopeptidase [Cyanothece sp. BG0011]|uniref:M67 family metallopeptidase n=1 Tax=Cyanothece sp. BG0011 TaxID=2082950 RepID=UPI000D1F7F40|nr:M67 family metallopeptidase [Cyanothece sp. BG0011]